MIKKLKQPYGDDTTTHELSIKINELIDEIDYWKKAHLQLQDQHIRLQTEVTKPQNLHLGSMRFSK